MNGVKANWDVLLTTAMRLMTNGELLGELVNIINNDVVHTQETWQGRASQAYQEQWATLLPQFKQAAENITSMGKQISSYVSAQQDIEQQAQNVYGQ